MTVWSFGCSHAAGHELQLDLTQQDMLAFYHKNGFKDWYDLWNCTNEKKKSKFYKKWEKQLGRNDHDLNLAYPSIVAKLKDTELKNYAISGSGIDYSYNQFLKIKSILNKMILYYLNCLQHLGTKDQPEREYKLHILVLVELYKNIFLIVLF